MSDTGPWIVAAMKAQLKQDKSKRTLSGIVMNLLCGNLRTFPDVSDSWIGPNNRLVSKDLKEAAKNISIGKRQDSAAEQYLTARYHRLFPNGTDKDWARYIKTTYSDGFYGAWQDTHGNYVPTNASFVDISGQPISIQSSKRL